MPRYDLLLISRAIGRNGLKSMLERTCSFIFDQGGVIRKIENLGEQELPYRMKAHAEWHTHGRYFIIDTHMKASSLPSLKRELKFDFDVIRPTLIRADCDFDEVEKKLPELYECDKSYELPYWLKNQ